MSPKRAMRDGLWEAIVVRTEALHDAAVLGQRTANLRNARKLARLASEIATLAEAAVLMGAPSRDDG